MLKTSPLIIEAVFPTVQLSILNHEKRQLKTKTRAPVSAVRPVDTKISKTIFPSSSLYNLHAWVQLRIIITVLHKNITRSLPGGPTRAAVSSCLWT